MMKYCDELQTPVGMLTIEADDTHLLGVLFAKEKRNDDEGIAICQNKIIKQTKTELVEYFEGRRSTFSIPIRFQGTEFQNNVWHALLDIPFGETSTYGNQAARINNPKAVRAVGAANGKNRISIIVPCHRIIGSDGTLTGYAGGLDQKKWLLQHEKQVVEKLKKKAQ